MIGSLLEDKLSEELLPMSSNLRRPHGYFDAKRAVEMLDYLTYAFLCELTDKG